MKNLKLVSIIVLGVALLVGVFSLSKSASAASTTLTAKSFSVWNQGGVIGYDAGFALSSDTTFSGAQYIIIKLYSGSTLLQTNTAVPGKIVGNEFVTPFDVFGTFNYISDGYFTNVRESEYGKVLAPTKVVITAKLADGKLVSATSTYLTGDTNTIGVTPISGQVLGAESFRFTSKIMKGSEGAQVTELQKLLNNAGYDCGTVDGAFGPKTLSALIKFQTANSLDADGVVGPQTREALNK